MRWIAPLLVVCFAGSTASADGLYFSEGVGGTKVTDELAAYMPSSARIRLAIGTRHEQWALEGFVAANVQAYDDAPYAGHPDPGRPYPPDAGYRNITDVVQYGLDVKYLNPISKHLEVYLRGSINAAQATGALDGWSGRGLGVGAGIQLKGKVPALGFLWWPLFFTNLGPKVTAAVWLDDGYDFIRLHGPHPTAIDAQLTHMTLGIAVGSDF